MPMLLERVLTLGADKGSLVAAVFGGACVCSSGSNPTEASLGRRNLAEALDFLRKHDIPVIREDVGGDEGRKLVFHTLDGITHVRKL